MFYNFDQIALYNKFKRLYPNYPYNVRDEMKVPGKGNILRHKLHNTILVSNTVEARR